MRFEGKVIPGFDNYMCNENGEIFSIPRNVPNNRRIGGVILKHRVKENGYHQVCLYSDSVYAKRMYVHRIVALCFYGYSKLEVNHKDGVKSNNSLSNLEYVTRSQNGKHAFAMGLNKPPYKGVGPEKVKHSNHIRFIFNGVEQDVYSYKKLAEVLGMSYGKVERRVRNNKPIEGLYIISITKNEM